MNFSELVDDRALAEIKAIMDEWAPLPPGESKSLPERLRAEVHDFHLLYEHCSAAYYHMTDGLISNPLTLPSEVIRVADDVFTDAVREAVLDECQACYQ